MEREKSKQQKSKPSHSTQETSNATNTQQNKITLRKVMRYFLRRIPLNIGTFIFGLLFIYMLISMVMYITADHIESYMVTAGPLAQNQIYTGIALREETIVTADASGYITYYARSNTKVAEDGVIYSVGATPTENSVETLTASDYSKIRSSLASFSANYSNYDFNEIYSYKYGLEGTIQLYTGLADSEDGTTMANGQSIYTAPRDGVVLYSKDGYEDLNIDDLSKDWFNKGNYKFTNLRGSDKVTAGKDVYKLITNESWSIIIPLTSDLVIPLSERTTIRVKFLKDNATQVGRLTILTDNDGYYYAQITFSNGMIRYANERFLDIELVTNLKSGLKIPLTSIVKKEFFAIPKEFLAENNKKNGFYVVTGKDDKGNTTKKFVEATIYSLQKEDILCYVDMTTLQKNDLILKSDSQVTYKLTETVTWDGVFCINKGYAVFRKVSIIEQNDEYCIVQIGTPYGISQFDYIVRNGDSVQEDDILYD